MTEISRRTLKKLIALTLNNADLAIWTSKKVRQRCEEEFVQDLSLRRQEIDDIINEVLREQRYGKQPNGEQPNGKQHNEESDNDESGSVTPKSSSDYSGSEDERLEEQPAPENKTRTQAPKKKQTKKKDLTSKSEDDAAVAQKLQDEEWNFRHRSVKKMSNRKVNSSKKKHDDSEGKPKARKGTSAYSRKCQLSPELAAVLDESEMARHDVVKRMWALVRERNLFDPSNKQFAICDEQLFKIIGTKKFRMFGMMKYLKHHIKDIK